jgi:hypothetical protein
LKGNFGEFLEIKECNAEGKTSACQKNKLYFSYVLQNFHKKIYISNVIILKNEKIFSKMIFLKSLKNIPKRVRSTKMSSCNLT